MGREIVALTDSYGRGAWACVVGDTELYGTFANFTSSVLKTTTLSYSADDAMTTTLSIDSAGGLHTRLTMGWHGPMAMIKTADVSGQHNTTPAVEVPLASHMRYDNPYAEDLERPRARGGPGQRREGVSFPLRGGVRFVFDSQALELDFDKGIRTTVDLDS